MGHNTKSGTKTSLREVVSGFTRRDDITELLTPGGVGVELGVATGLFSEKLLIKSKLSHLYSIDRWAGDRGHDDSEYKAAIRRLMPYRERNSIIRLSFDAALDLFPNEYFDFIYVDGYAHTGEEGGKTFFDWYPKLKRGGIFAGDDYSDDWPLVKQNVDRFISEMRLEMFLLNNTSREDTYSQFPTWFTFKQ
jgi:hypothetical protein